MIKTSDIPAIAGGHPVRNTMIPYARQWIGNEEIEKAIEVLKSDWLTTGPLVTELEKDFISYVRCKSAAAVTSCTSGLLLSLTAINISPGDEVITTPFTFVATSTAIVNAGGIPVFADINPHTLNISPDEIDKKISSKTKAILPVHFAGNPCEMDKLFEIAEKHKLWLIFDAAHALGAEYNEKKIGALGDFASFSFHAVKNITSGEGGIVTSKHPELCEKIKKLRFYGISKDAWARETTQEKPWLYDVEILGFKHNMMELQAALAIVQLKKLNKFQEIRKKYVEIYKKELSSIPEIILPSETKNANSAWHLFTILVDLDKIKVDRDSLLQAYRAENVGASLHYKPVHLHSYFRKQYGYQEGDFPAAEKVYHSIITLPLFPKMTEKDVYSVIEATHKIFNFYRK